MCSGEVVIIQNPECLHVGELIQSVAENIDDSRYLSYACYNVGERDIENLYNAENKKDFILSLPQEFNQSKGDAITWYNHSHYRKVDFHFTTAITRKNLESINGFDERYKYGMEFVGWWIPGHESLISSKPLPDVASLKDFKFRSPPGMESEIFAVLGA